MEPSRATSEIGPDPRLPSSIPASELSRRQRVWNTVTGALQCLCCAPCRRAPTPQPAHHMATSPMTPPSTASEPAHGVQRRDVASGPSRSLSSSSTSSETSESENLSYLTQPMSEIFANLYSATLAIGSNRDPDRCRTLEDAREDCKIRMKQLPFETLRTLCQEAWMHHRDVMKKMALRDDDYDEVYPVFLDIRSSLTAIVSTTAKKALDMIFHNLEEYERQASTNGFVDATDGSLFSHICTQMRDEWNTFCQGWKIKNDIPGDTRALFIRTTIVQLNDELLGKASDPRSLYYQPERDPLARFYPNQRQ